MTRQIFVRAALSVVAAAGTGWLGVQPQVAPQTAPQSVAGSAAEERPTLRVGMWTLWHDREVELTPAGPGDKVNLRSCEGCAALSFALPVKVRGEGNALLLTGAGRTGSARQIWITGPETLTAHGESVTLDDPVTIGSRAGVLMIAVTLPVENYVERVVASESGQEDSPESLMALAIAVRSFALHEKHGHADYDVCDSTHCQLLHWSPSAGRHGAQAHEATLATAGETLWFHGQRAPAYFGKDCGGRTASPDEIWLHGISASNLPSRPDPFCTTLGGSEWASEISRADLTAALAAHGLAVPGWHSLTVARRGESGRAITLRIDAKEISAEDFRLAVGESLGWNRIGSTWFEVSAQGDRFAFHGRGWGHGVGLCQKGAMVMARQGRTAQEILAQYFPGAEADDESTGRAWMSFRGDGFVLESLDAGDASYLSNLNRARAEAGERSGLHAPQPITVRTFASTTAFRQATLAPGWVAAFTEGDWIGTQPLHVLSGRRLLPGTMRHEFLHALVERQANAETPLWLREGLVEFWSEADRTAEAAATREPAPALTPDAVNAALGHASNQAESATAHRAAARYAAQLLARYGRAQVLEWLRSGLPAGVAAGIGQR